jgi:hypothetical protein
MKLSVYIYDLNACYGVAFGETLFFKGTPV